MDHYTLQLTLQNRKPLNQRVIQIKDHLTFDNLAQIICDLYGFTGEHLREYKNEEGLIINHPLYSMPPDHDVMVADFEDPEFDDLQGIGTQVSSSTYKLSDYFTNNTHIVFIYDFGENWRFDIQCTRSDMSDLSISPTTTPITSPPTPLLSAHSPSAQSLGEGGSRIGNEKSVWQYFWTPHNIVHLAKELRKWQTKAEEYFWEIVRDRGLFGIKFRRQHPFGRYIADFFSNEIGLVIELDWPVHHKTKEYDQERDQTIKSYNIKILRFANDDVFNDIEWVLQKIYDHIQRTHPQLLSSPNNISPLLAKPKAERVGEGLGVRYWGVGGETQAETKNKTPIETSIQLKDWNEQDLKIISGTGSYLLEDSGWPTWLKEYLNQYAKQQWDWDWRESREDFAERIQPATRQFNPKKHPKIL